MLTNATVADLLRPSEKSRAGIYDLILIFAGLIFIGLSAQLAIGFPVPITGQTFAVLMIGALYGARLGSMCLVSYILAGAVGVPVFSNFGSGVLFLSGPTGGFLFGFIAAAYVVGLLAERGWDRRVWTTILAMVLGNLVLYAFGLLWLFCLMGFNTKVLAMGLYPFIPGDILKIALAAALLPSGWKLLEYTRFLGKK
jgi:biotin transport system substrate-specific component